jgi:DNA-binding transcriptional LysR family regulator
LLRLEVQGTLARHFVVPRLPDFFAEYPDIEISMSETERWIDLIREGVDRGAAAPDLRCAGLSRAPQHARHP